MGFAEARARAAVPAADARPPAGRMAGRLLCAMSVAVEVRPAWFRATRTSPLREDAEAPSVPMSGDPTAASPRHR